MDLTVYMAAAWAWFGLKLLFIGIALKLFYFRVYKYFVLRRFYESQPGVKIFDGTYPLTGVAIRTGREMYREKEPDDNVFCQQRLLEEETQAYGAQTYVAFGDAEPILYISDPKIVQDLYTTNN